jgi:hypothetical protein
MKKVDLDYRSKILSLCDSLPVYSILGAPRKMRGTLTLHH